MNAEELAAIRERRRMAKRLAAGLPDLLKEWNATGFLDGGQIESLIHEWPDMELGESHDVTFFLHSIADMDALLAEVEQLRTTVAALDQDAKELRIELTDERRALAAARKGMATLTARWRQQLRDHGDYATRIADNPDLVATYRDTCTKTGVYDRVIGELDGLLKLVAPNEADGGEPT